MPIGPPSQVREPKSARIPAPGPIAARYAPERGCTGSRDTSACQTLPAGNSGHPEAASDGAARAGAAAGAPTARVSAATTASKRMAGELSQNHRPAERRPGPRPRLAGRLLLLPAPARPEQPVQDQGGADGQHPGVLGQADALPAGGDAALAAGARRPEVQPGQGAAEEAEPEAGQAGGDEPDAQQGRPEGDLARRQQLHEVLGVHAGELGEGLGGLPVQPPGGVVVGPQLLQALVDDDRPGGQPDGNMPELGGHPLPPRMSAVTVAPATYSSGGPRGTAAGLRRVPCAWSRAPATVRERAFYPARAPLLRWEKSW